MLFFREATDDRVRVAALETIAEIGSVEAGLFLLEVVRHETGVLRKTAESRLGSFPGDEIAQLKRSGALG